MTDGREDSRGHEWLAATVWPAEDGGPRRQQRPHGLAGPDAGGARLVAVHQAPLSVMALQAPGGRLLLLRKEPGDGPGWVEELHPESLEVLGRSPDLDVGPFWPGGAAVMADGAVVVVQGRFAHRLDPDLGLAASRALPVDAAYNSFVVLGDGTIATKDLQRPDGVPSTLSLLDPVTLEDRAAPVVLAEPSVARLSADGHEVVVVGVTALHRLAWDPAAGALAPAHPAVPYLEEGDTRSFGWDPVVDAGHVWWLDDGDHTWADGLTMLGNGVAPGSSRLWRAPIDGGPAESVEVSGLPSGAVTNPPLVDPERGLVVAYDSANAQMAAFDVDDLTLRWRIDLATAQHLVLYPDTGELVADDHDRESGDAVVVIDVETGAVRARAQVQSPAQSVVFGAPGLHRDVIYVSLSTVARVELTD